LRKPQKAPDFVTAKVEWHVNAPNRHLAFSVDICSPHASASQPDAPEHIAEPVLGDFLILLLPGFS
jgi:hypothetical protein